MTIGDQLRNYLASHLSCTILFRCAPTIGRHWIVRGGKPPKYFLEKSVLGECWNTSSEEDHNEKLLPLSQRRSNLMRGLHRAGQKALHAPWHGSLRYRVPAEPGHCCRGHAFDPVCIRRRWPFLNRGAILNILFRCEL